MPETGNGSLDAAILLAERESAQALLILAPKRISGEVLQHIPDQIFDGLGVAKIAGNGMRAPAFGLDLLDYFLQRSSNSYCSPDELHQGFAFGGFD